MRALAALLLVLALLPLAHAATVSQPVYTVGDAWEYEGNATASAGTAQLRRHVEVVEAGEEIVLRWVTQTRTSLGSNGTIDQWFWYRAGDLALLRTASYTKATTANASSEARALTNYTTPCVERAYPLEVGKAWIVGCGGSRTTMTETRRVDDSESRRENATVEREGTTVAPSGTFPTVRVVHQATSTDDRNEAEYAQSACNDATIRNLRRGTTTELALVAWRCASTRTAGGTLTITLPPTPSFDPPAPTVVSVPQHAQPAPGLVGLVAAVGALALARRAKR
ncbi:MAG TPA: hypothetical protein VM370_00040 [Candidatus Thermoplasmatota archaeon]|nr:hypothetical protein [Candidatus Thermoplasmatota archaeon]